MKYENLYLKPSCATLDSVVPPKYDTLYICAENVIIQDKTLGFEIDLSKYLKDIKKINISGIVFVKEEEK